MEKFVLDDAASGKLATAHEPLEVLTSTGKRLGIFVPQRHERGAETDAEIYAWAKAQISEEELDRRARNPIVHSTAEVLRRLSEQ